MSARTSPLIAFGVASLGIALFSSMDALLKGLVLSLGLYNALAWRMFAGLTVSAVPYAMAGAKRPGREVLRIHVVRACVSVVMGLLFFWGLARVPMAQAIALAFVAPIITLFLAAVVLGEKITREALIATGLAFAGILIILFGQSQAEMGPEAFWGAIAVLASAVFYAWNIILMRQQSLLAGAADAAFFQSLFVAILYALPAPFLLTLPPLTEVPAIVLAAMLATASLFLLSWAYARAEANYLAPTEYTGFLWATLWGWVVFGEHVSFYTVAGAVLIVAGCILAARRRDHAPVADTEAQL